jgi:hypothetical protein
LDSVCFDSASSVGPRSASINSWLSDHPATRGSNSAVIDPAALVQAPAVIVNAGTAFSQRAPDVVFEGNRSSLPGSMIAISSPPARARRRLDVAHHERGIQPQHAVASASEHRVTMRIRARPLGVIPPSTSITSR